MSSDEPRAEELFACRRCGDCCRGYGGTYLSAGDIEAVARFLGIGEDEFIARYCARSGGRPILAQQPNGYCVFWDGLCAIHPVKPRMCRRWPFIEGLLVDPANWHQMASCCPGMRTDVSPERVRACAAAVLSAGRPEAT